MYKLHVSRIENQQPGNKHAAKLIQTADASTIIHLVELRHLPAYNNVHQISNKNKYFPGVNSRKTMLSAKIQHHIEVSIT